MGVIRVVSDASVVREVAAAPVADSLAGARFKPPLPLPVEVTGDLETCGLEVLISAALASNPFALHDPLDPMNLWALVRYFWAFDTATRGRGVVLRLHDRTKKIRYHHRTAMSEYLGIGVGALVAQRWLRHIYPGHLVRVVDAEAALADPALVAGVASSGTLRPDCLLQVEGGPLIVLECKGAQTRGRRPQALSRALRQVASITHHGSVPSGVAVHTTANCGGFEAVAIDPDGDADWSAEPADRGDPEIELSLQEAHIGDVGAFRGDVDRLADASLLAWSGAETQALEVLPQRLIPLIRERDVMDAPQELAAIDGIEFVGAESRFSLGGEEFSLFRGVSAPLWSALVGGRPDGLPRRRVVPARPFEVPGLVRTDEVWGFSADGAVARLRRV